jgi:hypothetical protein
MAAVTHYVELITKDENQKLKQTDVKARRGYITSAAYQYWQIQTVRAPASVRTVQEKCEGGSLARG